MEQAEVVLPSKPQPPPEIYQLHFLLLEISPAISRRLLVPNDCTIFDLHFFVQIAFGWSDTHLNRFSHHAKSYGVYHSGGMAFNADPKEVRLVMATCVIRCIIELNYPVVKEEFSRMNFLCQPLKSLCLRIGQRINHTFKTWTKPAKPSQVLGTLSDVNRSKAGLMAENALLCQQLIVLSRKSKVNRPHFKPLDRFLIILLASKVSAWQQALLILQPDTLLRWHRQGFRLFWKLKSKPKSIEPKISPETVVLIKQMATENQTWGAERIRGELLKLGIKVAKRTIQKYMKRPPPPRRPNQNWSTFLKNHGSEIWACDYFGVTDILFRQLYAFVVIELRSRRIVHIGVTRHPTDEWTAQQLKEATPFEEKPKYLIRDNDRKFGPQFEKAAQDSSIEILKTPIKAPNANAVCERLIGSIRRECLDFFLILNEQHLSKVLKEYVRFYNHWRPHQGIRQQRPVRTETLPEGIGKIVAFPVLGGLHHSYQRVA